MFLFPPKRPRLALPGSQLACEALGNQFTREERARIMALRRQFVLCPDSLKLGLNYQRLMFARWLIQQGLLDEETDGPVSGPRLASPFG